MLRFHVIYMTTILVSSAAMAAPAPTIAPGALDQNKLPPNPVLAPKVEAAVQQSMRVSGESEGFILVEAPGMRFKPGSLVLFMRPDRDHLEILARGTVKTQQGTTLLVVLDLDTVNKVPDKNDRAISISPPMTWGEEKKDIVEQPLTIEEELPPEPGHIQITTGYLNGKLGSQSETQANEYKVVPSFRFQDIHIEWYPEFLWRVGIEYEEVAGVYPTFSYYHEEEETTGLTRKISFNYRLRPFQSPPLRATFRLTSFSEDFDTTNPDEAVLGSIYSGTGVGLRLSREWVSNVWKPSGSMPLALNQIYLIGTFYPLLSAKDKSVSRGESSGSMAYEWNAGATFLLYLDFIPFLKRYAIDLQYGQRTYLLKFSGETTGESGGPYTIPKGSSPSETVGYWSIRFGVRLDDFIGKFMMPR